MDYIKNIKDLHGSIELDPVGEVEFTVPGGYHGEDVYITYTIEELERVLAEAKAHRTAYQAYKDNDYEEVIIPDIGDPVRINAGRSKGYAGKVEAISGIDAWVVSGNDEGYWIRIKNLEVIK